MRLKLDENLGRDCATLLRAAGHDVATVPGQSMESASDRDLIATCRDEGRCLVTHDLDFANPLLFPPSQYAGIAVVRLPHNPSLEDILAGLRTLSHALAEDDIHGKLWVVQRGRIREYCPDDR
ncbi:MAG: DUF5615 family PIN-like protein [Candidatus Brocadiia bacterium]